MSRSGEREGRGCCVGRVLQCMENWIVDWILSGKIPLRGKIRAPSAQYFLRHIAYFTVFVYDTVWGVGRARAHFCVHKKVWPALINRCPFLEEATGKYVLTELS